MSSKQCGCKVEPIKPKEKASAQGSSMLALVIDGMGCHNCVVRVQNALLSVRGVAYASVRLELPLATVAFDPERVGADDLIAAVASAGMGTHHEYRARPLLGAQATVA